MKKLFKIAGVFMLALCAVMLLAACSNEGNDQQPATKYSISLDGSGLLLSKGDTATLSTDYNGTGTITYTSSDESVATVSADGTVTAVSKGNAVITATDGELSANCGVIVDLDTATELIDVRKQTLTRVLAEKYLLTLTVMQNIVVDGEDIYIIQRCDATPSDLIIQKYDEDNISEWMVLTGFGSGVGFSVERGQNGELYFWTESNGNADSEGLTISRFKWEPGTVLVQQGAQTWNFNQSEGAVYASVDQDNGLVCIRTISAGGYMFTYYDLESMANGDEPAALYTIELDMLTAMLDKDINPTGTAVGQYGFQGFAISGQYIYQYYGTANSGAFLAVYDMEGEAQYVHRIAEYADLEFREADGMTIADGKIYVAMATGLSGDRRANAFIYE